MYFISKNFTFFYIFRFKLGRERGRGKFLWFRVCEKCKTALVSAIHGKYENIKNNCLKFHF